MSGGRFEYKDSSLKDEIFGYFFENPEHIPNIFEDEEISELIWDVFDLIHDYDWYASGDTDESDWIKSKTNFKNKWFKHYAPEERD